MQAYLWAADMYCILRLCFYTNKPQTNSYMHREHNRGLQWCFFSFSRLAHFMWETSHSSCCFVTHCERRAGLATLLALASVNAGEKTANKCRGFAWNSTNYITYYSQQKVLAISTALNQIQFNQQSYCLLPLPKRWCFQFICLPVCKPIIVYNDCILVMEKVLFSVSIQFQWTAKTFSPNSVVDQSSVCIIPIITELKPRGTFSSAHWLVNWEQSHMKDKPEWAWNLVGWWHRLKTDRCYYKVLPNYVWHLYVFRPNCHVNF